MKTLTLLLVSVVLVMETGDCMAEGAAGVRETPGLEAAEYKILGSFVLQAPAVRRTAAWDTYLGQYGIDPEWPAAELLGRAGDLVYEEFRSRLAEAALTPAFVTSDGLDPNDWKNEALGRAFGETFAELQRDGFEMALADFVLMIEARVRPGITYFSIDPLDEAKEARDEELFWRGLEAVIPDARPDARPRELSRAR